MGTSVITSESFELSLIYIPTATASVGDIMDISALDVSYVAVGILTTASAILVSKYRKFKSFLWFAEKALTDLLAIVRELKELASTLNDANASMLDSVGAYLE